MENEPLNSIQNLINKLSEKTFIDNINDLLRNEATNSFLKSFLIELKKNKKLNDLYLSKEYDYIKNYYNLASNKFQKDQKVSLLSYGLVKYYNSIYLYIKKEEEETLNYIKNFQNITPVGFDDYIKINSNPSIKSELSLKGGMNLYGYLFEFNLNYFFQTLSDLIELPDLVINLTEGIGEEKFKELDIAYYNKEPSTNQNISLLKTSFYSKIFEGTIIIENDKNFEIYEKSLVLGEIKASFPRKLNKEEEIDKRQSLQTIINKLFEKLFLFYQIYKLIKLFGESEIKNIQLIFFYDHVQVKKINEIKIKQFINDNKNYWNDLNKKIPIHLFIVYTLPAITNISIYELKKEIQLLKQKDDVREKEMQLLKQKDDVREKEMQSLEKEIQDLQETNKQILMEIQELKINTKKDLGQNQIISADKNEQNDKIEKRNELNLYEELNKVFQNQNSRNDESINNNINNNIDYNNNNNYNINNIYDFTSLNNTMNNNNEFNNVNPTTNNINFNISSTDDNNINNTNNGIHNNINIDINNNIMDTINNDVNNNITIIGNNNTNNNNEIGNLLIFEEEDEIIK